MSRFILGDCVRVMATIPDTGCLSRTVLPRRKKAGPTFWKWVSVNGAPY